MSARAPQHDWDTATPNNKQCAVDTDVLFKLSVHCIWDVAEGVSKATVPKLRRYLGLSVFLLAYCWFQVSMYPEGPVTVHTGTGFLVFPLFSSRLWKSFQFPSWFLRCSEMPLCVMLLVTERIYQHIPPNTPEERRPRLHDDGNLKFGKFPSF